MFDPIRIVFDLLSPESIGGGFAQIYYFAEDSRLIDIGKVIGAILSVAGAIGLFIVFFLRTKEAADHSATIAQLIIPPEAAPEGGLGLRWSEVEKHINSEREAEWKFAVIEADKLMDDVIKSAGFLGDSMGDRLMNVQPGQIVSIDDIWEAHKIRNRLVHDANYFLRYGEARRAVDLYRKALNEFGAI